MLYMMFMAGLDTVIATLGFWRCLGRLPVHRQRLINEPDVSDRAVDEVITVNGLLNGNRTVARDLDFAGGRMLRGEEVLLPTMSTGQHPRAWQNPEIIDFDRDATGHLSFGGGIHRCGGAPLDRLQLSTSLEEWHHRIPHDDLVDGNDLGVRTGGLAGLSHLPLQRQPVA
jgi:cytochrome P450